MKKLTNRGVAGIQAPTVSKDTKKQSFGQERQKPLIDFAQFPLIHQLFEAQAERTPDAIAIGYEGEQLTYRELNGHSNQLAHYLQENGVGPEVLVGICMERSLELVIGLLAILKAGGAYVPLDPTYPSERLGFILSDTQAPVLLTQPQFLDLLPPQQAQVICPQSQQTAIANCSHENLATSVAADNLAYVIYTSGSTGRPKGVMIEHRNTTALIAWASQIFTVEDLAGVLASTSICFDLSVFELFVTLSLGGTVILAQNALQLPRLLAARQVTLVNTVPSAIAELLRTNSIPTSVRTINLAGEPLQNGLVQQLYQRSTAQQVFNLYGPSEDTTYSTFALIPEGSQEIPAIGYPIDQTTAYLLNEQLEPVADGVIGELYLGGAGLARGYLNRPDLTDEKFIPHPSGEAGKRLYKTGDLARYRSDGSLEFLGRLDNQVKIRGFRIELGEIEALLWEHPRLEAAVVIASGDTADQQLIAYVVPREQANHEPQQQPALIRELRSALQQQLPDYMVPTGFVVLDALPLTPNGKIDRRSLPTPTSLPQMQVFVAPRTPLEESLVEIWQAVLGRPHIGIYDNFLELGGHSLLATRIMMRIWDVFQIELPLRSLFELPTIAALAKYLETRSLQPLEAQPRIPLVTRDQALSLSFSQQQLWFLDQFISNPACYNVPEVVRLQGPLNIAALEQSLAMIIERHEALRTTIAIAHGQPVQVIHPVSAFSLPVVRFTTSTPEDPETQAWQAIADVAQQPLNLSQGPLFRATLFQLNEKDHLLLLNLHHIICDEWSFGVLFAEMTTLYSAYTHQQSPTLPELPIQYADFALWQRRWLQGEIQERQLAYWKHRLGGELPVLQLPTDYPRSPLPTYQGARQFISLPPSLTGQLKTLSTQTRTTLFMTLLAAFQTLLYRYTGQSDVLVGSPVANRSRSEVADLIGFFVNTLVLRTDLSGTPSFLQLLQRVREVALEAYAHQDLPFEQVVQAVQPNRAAGDNPLFEVLFNLQTIALPNWEIDELHLTRLSVDCQTAKFTLSVELTETPDGIVGHFEYNTDLFKSETIARMVGHFQTLLEGIVAHPELSIDVLPLLTALEQRQLATWNQTQISNPTHLLLHQLFEAQVEQTPEAIAVTYEHQSLTYQQLNQQANQLAHHLQALGVGPEILVGLCTERSLEMVIGILAILKAGGAYVPLDPAYPQDRLSFMLQDCNAPVLLTQTHLSSAFANQQAQVVYLDQAGQFAPYSQKTPSLKTATTNLAYVIYTSGSTGRPKGVAIAHSSPVALVQWAQSVFSAEQLAGVLASTSICFDLSVFELFVTLSAGGQVILAQNALQLPTLPAAEAVTLINTVPSAIAELLRVQGIPASVQTVNLAGEPLPNQLVQQIYQQTTVQRVYNLYGPSEDTTYSTYALIEKESHDIPAIGRPIHQTQAYVLDAHQQQVPVGVPGELYLGGAGLAQGYLNRPKLTAEKFVTNPFSTQPGERLYRTGDLVRYRANGDLEFLGRIDHLVKVRGFRIELGEIEAVLGENPRVQQVVVIVREDESGDQQLVAYVVAGDGHQPTVSELRQWVQQKLPTYMVPNAFVLLESLPLTPNGKVDRRALPQPDHLCLRPTIAYVAPQSEIERAIAEIWQQILKLEQVGIYDNFFDLGGHSLLLVQVQNQLCDRLQSDLSVVELFQYPTIHALAQRCSQKQTESAVLQQVQSRAQKQKAAVSRQKQLMQRGRKTHG